jgi:4'-phosphopantetheinyl transferase
MSAACVLPGSGGRAAAVLRLAPRVAVWQVALDLPGGWLAAAAPLLTPEELAHADRGAPPVRRRRIALRAGLRAVLGRALACPPRDVPLGRTAQGRPRVEVPGWDASCARSEELGLLAVARGALVGVDVERVVPWTDDILAEGWLAPAESRFLLTLPSPERAPAATRCWTGKEAVLKAVGSGLSVPPELVVTAGGRWADRCGPWALADVAVPHGFRATLACSPPVSPQNPRILPRPLPGPTSPTGHRP